MMGKNMMGRGGMMGGMMGRGNMGGGMMGGRMGSENHGHCPMCSGSDDTGRGRQFLSKEEKKELLKEYLKELEAEAKAVKGELVEEK